jgi:hypothetical protein
VVCNNPPDHLGPEEDGLAEHDDGSGLVERTRDGGAGLRAGGVTAEPEELGIWHGARARRLARAVSICVARNTFLASSTVSPATSDGDGRSSLASSTASPATSDGDGRSSLTTSGCGCGAGGTRLSRLMRGNAAPRSRIQSARGMNPRRSGGTGTTAALLCSGIATSSSLASTGMGREERKTNGWK